MDKDAEAIKEKMFSCIENLQIVFSLLDDPKHNIEISFAMFNSIENLHDAEILLYNFLKRRG